MIRFVKQRDQYRCGPIAILNALKWAGARVSSSDYLDYLTELSVCGPSPRGTWHKTFDRALRVAGEDFYSTRRIYYPTLGEIESHLQDGGAIVLNYYWRIDKEKVSSRHFQFLVGISPSGDAFYSVNRGGKQPTLQRLTRETFKKDDLRFQRVDENYKAWFLTKEEE